MENLGILWGFSHLRLTAMPKNKVNLAIKQVINFVGPQILLRSSRLCSRSESFTSQLTNHLESDILLQYDKIHPNISAWLTSGRDVVNSPPRPSDACIAFMTAFGKVLRYYFVEIATWHHTRELPYRSRGCQSSGIQRRDKSAFTFS